MVVRAKSLKLGGVEIKAENATYETYLQHLCRCNECGSEVYLAKGMMVKPHWRHFPGQGKHCPNKSVKHLTLHSFQGFQAVQQEQYRALFKTKFLEILDIGWVDKGCFKNRESSKNIAFTSIPVPGYQEARCIKFEDLLVEVDKLKKNLTAAKKVLKSALYQAFALKIKNQSQEWSLSKEILTQEYDQHSKICEEALEYIFGNGRQDLLKEILAKVVIMYIISGTYLCEDLERLQSFRKNDSKWMTLTIKDFPIWCIAGIITNLIHIPWMRIMSDLNQGIITEIRSDKFVWLFPSSNLENIKEVFGIKPKAKALGKSKKGFRL